MILNQKSILVLVALCKTIFSVGLIVGTRVFCTPNVNATNHTNEKNCASQQQHAESSPLVAATSKTATADIQSLILESAHAKAIEQRKYHIESEAI